MYNNAIIQTSYKPYIPPPKKKAVNNNEEKGQETKGRVVSPNEYQNFKGEKQPSSDTFTHSNVQPPEKINIKQVLIDFNSTLAAIGATEDVENEVKTYLGLVESQAQKNNPNKKIIVSNLKIAADVLDGYISDTLKKPSKVVKDWVDALLLQNIDFKNDASITKGAFESITGEQPQTAKLAEKKLAEKAQTQAAALQSQENTDETQKAEETAQPAAQQNPIHQDNPQVTALISQADKIIETEPKDALSVLSEAFTIAQNYSDKNSMAKIYSKIAEAQNRLNNLHQALDCLNASTILAYETENNTLKSHNHKQMASIYDEAGYMDTAMSHYFASLGVDGEIENTENQADTLNSIGKMYTQRYMKDEAIDYYKDALDLAKITGSLNIMSDSFFNTAITHKNSGDTEKAISNLKNAALLSEKAGNTDDLSAIYEEAGDLMVQKAYRKRAQDLYKKSYRMAEKSGDKETLSRLREKLYSIAA
ncbi:MAG: hypothetical protein K6A44_04030 [bacterium]|nr:hypothetical protein [bacterium]